MENRWKRTQYPGKTYALAEECIGWLNSRIILRAILKSKRPRDFNAWTALFMDKVKKAAITEKCDIAHFETYLVAEDDCAKASITGIDEEIDFSRKMLKKADEISLTVHASIHMESVKLLVIMDQALRNTCMAWNVEIEEADIECFNPSKPEPGYRIRDG